MKQKLTLLLIALVTSMGVWATSPATGAYPVEGKTYYLFANKYSSTDRYYLYWDNTNSALKRATANSKENNDYYKWTVTISDGKYIITNVGTDTKLVWDNNKGLTLNATGTLFDLSKTVHYTACVSLYNPSGFWCCVESSQETFRNGLKFSSYPSDENSATYPVDFVFEEVLSAHSLVDGSYYTIYCDNDNKQYIYDNAGTLAQTNSAPASDFRYVWQCIVNGDNYNFRNLQTGKYLGWRTISASAYNYTITTTQAIHDGCATMWGNNAERNWSIKTDGTLTGQTTTKDNKVTSDWCTDFRFDAIDLSSWLTGDLLGGSMSGTWTNTWTSATSPSFTLTASANNINNTNARTTGGLDIRSGQALTSTYNITAPTGYVITGYKIVGYALGGNQTVTPSKGGDATVFTTAGNSISVSGLRQGKAEFTLSGDNDGLFIRALQVSLEPIAGSITSLPTANNKAYVIYNARAAWNFADNATSMNALALDLNNAGQQIALIYHNDNYYLYSINAGKYLTAENTLTSVVTDNEQISITATGNDTYPWFFSFKNVANKNINIDGNPTVRINNHSTLDEGNRNAIIEADDFDATEALAMFNNRYVTYNLSYGGNDTFRTENNVVVAIGGNPADYVPESWKAAFCTFTYDMETIEESTTTVNVTMTWNGPFEFSTDYENAIWYYMTVGGLWLVNGESSASLNAEMQKDNAALWAFVGNPVDGIRIMNKDKGNGYYLNLGQTVAMLEGTGGYTLCDDFAQQDGNIFILGNEGFYLANYNNGAIAALKPPTPLTDNRVSIIVRSYYCQQALDDFADYVGESTDKYFGVKPSSVTSVNSMIESMPKMTEAQYTEYFTDLYNSFKGYISFNWPETGYYRIKNNKSGDYIGYGKPEGLTSGQLEKTAGLVAITSANVASDYSTVVRLTKVSATLNTGLYTISTQGLNVQGTPAAQAVYTASGSTPVQFKFVVDGTPGVVYIKDSNASGSEDATEGCLHEANWVETHTLNGIVPWTHGADASKWVVEDVTSLTINPTPVGDTYYATLCLPFTVNDLSGAQAYTLSLNDSKKALTLSDPITTVPAGTPVLLRGDDAEVTASIEYNEDYQAAPLTSTALTGTYTAKSVTGGTDYFLGYSGGQIGFYHWTGSTLGANRAYLEASKLSGSVKGFVLNFDDVDAVTDVPQSVPATSEWYDLSGRRINQPTQGLYIKNGKKVLVK